MYRKAWCTCKIVVLLIKPIAFVAFPLPSPSSDLKVPNKQQRRRQLQKRHSKVNSRCFNLYGAYSISFNSWWQIFLELNCKRLYQSSGIEKERRCPVFTSSTKREIRHFHVSCSRAPTAMKCTKKRVARAKLLFCQSKPIAFLPISLPSLPLLLKLPSD